MVREWRVNTMYKNKRNLIIIVICVISGLGVGAYGFTHNMAEKFAAKKQRYEQLRAEWEKEYVWLHSPRKGKTKEELGTIGERMYANEKSAIELAKLFQEVDPLGFAAKKQRYEQLKAEWNKEFQELRQSSGTAKTDEERRIMEQRLDTNKKKMVELAKLKQEVDPPTPEEFFERKLDADIAVTSDCIQHPGLASPWVSTEKLKQRLQRLLVLEEEYRNYKKYKEGKAFSAKSFEELQKEFEQIKNTPVND